MGMAGRADLASISHSPYVDIIEYESRAPSG